MNVYKECTSDHKLENFVFAGYKESYCVLEYNITCVAVNFYWSELDTLSGQIYCTLDIFGYCTVI